ncbi:hypothetical protein SESBI_35797 [Sesbania bispinosa]|nr:hypothetical protein SESBI_35797 [Sesbania bispinosa]
MEFFTRTFQLRELQNKGSSLFFQPQNRGKESRSLLQPGCTWRLLRCPFRLRDREFWLRPDLEGVVDGVEKAA